MEIIKEKHGYSRSVKNETIQQGQLWSLVIDAADLHWTIGDRLCFDYRAR